MFKKRELSSCIALALATTGVAVAQDGSNDIIEEIVVSATKRASSVQDVPYNISAVSGDSLERAGITDMAHLARSIPGIAFMDKGPRSAGAFANAIAMRGLNVDSSGNTSDRPGLTAPTVATYVGNTPMFTALRLKDIERIEVLRGPQGTLYGSGAMGGIIQIVQKKPNLDETELTVSTRFGVTDGSDGFNSETDVIFNMPMADNFAIRGNVGYVNNDGFIDSPQLFQVDANGAPILADPSDPAGSPAALTSKKDVNEEEILNGRFAALWDISDDVSATLIYQFQRDDIAGGQGDTPILGELQSANISEQPFDRDVDLVSLDVESDLGFATMTVAMAQTEVTGNMVQDVSYGYAGSLADGLNFPGYFGSGLDLYTEYYGNNPRFLVSSGRVWTDEVDTAEIRFVSNTDGSYDWLVGLTYLNQKTDFRQEDSNFGRNDYIAAVNAAGVTLVGQDGTLASGPGFFTGPTANDLVYFFDNKTEFTDLALFGEFTYHFSDDWQVTGGVRYFDQDIDADQFGGIVAGGFLGGSQLSIGEQDTLFKINSSYDFGDDTKVFFTWAEGFRRGGVNAVPEAMLRPDRGENLIYAPDEVTSTEIGLKGGFSDSWNYTATLFSIDWDNAQLNTNLTALALIGVTNVPKSETRGLEFELRGNFTDALEMNFGYSYVDTEVTQSIVEAERLAIVGSRLPVPEHTASLALTYFQELSGDSELIWSTNASYRGDTPSSPQATSGANALGYVIYDGFSLLDVAVAYNRDNWSVTGFVNNVTNERGTLGGNPGQRDGPFGHLESVVRPLTFGISLTYNFTK